jgi:hypothetical protein
MVGLSCATQIEADVIAVTTMSDGWGDIFTNYGKIAMELQVDR